MVCFQSFIFAARSTVWTECRPYGVNLAASMCVPAFEGGPTLATGGRRKLDAMQSDEKIAEMEVALPLLAGRWTNGPRCSSK